MVPDNEIVVFKVDLNELFEIIIAADYLEVENLLKESYRNVFINNKWEIIEDAASCFYDPKVATLLQDFEREYGEEVIVTIFDDECLQYLDTKVMHERKSSPSYIVSKF